MDEGGAGLLRMCMGRAQRFLEEGPGQLRVRAVVASRLDLGHRRLGRHEDRRLDPRLARGPRDGLAVVACAGGHDAGFALDLAQAFDLVDGSADLERARALERLGLQVHRPPGQPREGLRSVERSVADALAGDPASGGLDVSECWGGLRRQA